MFMYRSVMTARQILPLDDPACRELARQLRVMALLWMVGMAAAALIGKAARTRGAVPGGLAALTYGLVDALHRRVTRALRLAETLLLRLDVQLARARKPPALEAEPAERLDRQERLEPEETLESLLRSEFSRTLLARPVDELIVEICRDLGLDPAWAVRVADRAPMLDIDQVATDALEVLAQQALDADSRGDAQPPALLPPPPRPALLARPTAASP